MSKFILTRLTGLRTPACLNRVTFHRSINNTAEKKASLDQLTKIEEKISVQAPRFFMSPLDYSLYTQDVTLIDNIRNIKSVGLLQYSLQLNSVKIYHSISYGYASVELLSLVKVPEESLLKVRWRIITKPGITKLIFFFWRYHKEETWRDGISTLHVNEDGKIYCHVCDNIEIDAGQDASVRRSLEKPPQVCVYSLGGKDRAV